MTILYPTLDHLMANPVPRSPVPPSIATVSFEDMFFPNLDFEPAIMTRKKDTVNTVVATAYLS